MTEERDSRAQPVIRPGAALKALRIKRGWSLAEVSRRTGLPVSSLSKVENDKMDLTLDKLLRIGTALETDLAHLIAPLRSPAAQEQPAGRRSITRAGDGKLIASTGGQYRYLAHDLLYKLSLPMLIEVTARSLEEFGEFNHHPGEEFLFVIEGELDLYTSVYLPVSLKKGDSMYFDANMGHAYVAAGPGPCRILSVCVAAEMRDLTKSLERRQSADEVRPPEPAKRAPHRR